MKVFSAPFAVLFFVITILTAPLFSPSSVLAGGEQAQMEETIVSWKAKVETHLTNRREMYDKLMDKFRSRADKIHQANTASENLDTSMSALEQQYAKVISNIVTTQHRVSTLKETDPDTGRKSASDSWLTTYDSFRELHRAMRTVLAAMKG